MCSIIGCFEKNGFADIEVVERMNRVLEHRGPDDSGMDTVSMFGAEQHNVGIGFNRLSIRDLSQAGHQPMYGGEDGSIIITFNGEIYNADQFREELMEAGHSFRGTSDTEVLLHLYEEYGIDEMLGIIDGMFAVCIIDREQDCIYLIRDRIGEKPLYYYENGDVFMWASEYKAFYEHPSFQPEIASENLSEYFMFRYISDNDTLLKNVRNLKPGAYLRIGKEGIAIHQYWDFPESRPDDEFAHNMAAGGGANCRHNGQVDMLSEFNRLLEKAYLSRIVSDVEIGVQLSGGIDSSCITQHVSEAVNHKLKTFGIVFDGKDYSEREYMELVVNQCNTDSFMYELPNELFLQCWLLVTYFFEAPMNHEGTLGLFYLNKRASEEVKVMLCGEGADETMGGYQRFYDIERYQTSFLFRMETLLKRVVRAKRICPSTLFRDLDADGVFIKASQYVQNDDVKELYPGCDCDGVMRKRRNILKNTRGAGLRKYMNYETVTYCQDLLMRADKVSMASSLEVRVPYLMPKLVEFENSMPDECFVSVGTKDYIHNSKKALKKRSESLFGGDFTYRPKQGFGIRLMDYLSCGQVKDFIEKVLLPGIRARGLLNYDYIKGVYQKKCACTNHKGNDGEVWVLWTAFSFEIWAEMYIDRNPNEYYREAHIEMQGLG